MTAPERPTVHRMLMDIALVVAQRSTCSRLQVGAVLARDGRVLSTGYNGAPSGLEHCRHELGANEPCTESVHAEANAIVQAARHGVSTDETCLYLTHAPCLGCSGLILNSGVKGVFYQEFYKSELGIKRLKQSRVRVEKLGVGPDPMQTAYSRNSWKWW